MAPDCNNDEGFLLLYREMALRARSMVSGSFKFQASDFIESWTNYLQLFAFIRNVDAQDLVLTAQWKDDIIQEFVYQFQGFCQYRAQLRSERDASLLLENRQAWAAPTVYRTLLDLVAMQSPNAPVVKAHFAYFATIELARLECLLGDFSSSIQTVGGIRLTDRTELIHSVPSAHVSVFYHAGVSLLMLRRFADTIALLSEALLHISRVLRPGAASLRTQAQQLLQKTMEKMLSLIAIAMALSPGQRVDDQVRDIVESKALDKLRRLQAGEIGAFEDIFESSCPKFVSPCVPSEYPVAGNLCQEEMRMHIAVFLNEVRQHAALLRLRSYVRMYSSIELAKLARFNESSETDFVAQLIACKHKNAQILVPTTVV